MAGKNQSTGKSSRERRLAAALRENVKRRKAQARARAIAQEARDQAGGGCKHTAGTHDSAGIPSDKTKT
jgi:hypothetical protein